MKSIYTAHARALCIPTNLSIASIFIHGTRARSLHGVASRDIEVTFFSRSLALSLYIYIYAPPICDFLAQVAGCRRR